MTCIYYNSLYEYCQHNHSVIVPQRQHNNTCAFFSTVRRLPFPRTVGIMVS